MSNLLPDRVRDKYTLTADVSRLSIPTIYRWLSTEAYWSRGRTREALDTSIENSCLYGVLTSDGQTVACARIVTDHVTFAWVGDVFVDPAHRRRGLATWMVGDLVEYWTSVGVRHLLLATRDAHTVYAAAGFAPLAHPERFMEIDRRAPF